MMVYNGTSYSMNVRHCNKIKKSEGNIMAGLFGKIFDTRTKEDKQRDFEKYTNMIFPYGEEQRNQIFELLDQLFPKLNQKYLRMHYIIVKEQMIGESKLSFEEACDEIKKKTLIKTNENINQVLKELLNVDISINEKLEYPSSKDIMDRSL